jgi:hypothetical protein
MNNRKGVLRRLLPSAACLILAMTATVAMAQTGTAPVSGKFSGLVYNRATQTFNSVLTLTNTGAATLQSPLSIVIATGTAAVTVAGTTDGSTYTANLSGGSLVPSASATVVVAFADPTRVAFTPSVVGLAGLVPGTVTVAQSTISSASGGTITVSGAGNPLNGTKVVIPPGALGDATDTITVGYSTALPGPINPTATAAGLVPVSNVLSLTRAGSSPLQLVIRVTMPYSLATLGPKDFPFVAYWDSNASQYQPVQVISADQTAGTVTFVAKHMTLFLAGGIKGLADMLQGTQPFPAQLQYVDSGFRPENDGFEAENFSTQKDFDYGGSGGVCFGLTSFAAWYYWDKPTPKPLFKYSRTRSDPGDPHIPQEDSLAREVFEQTYWDTRTDNVGYLEGFTEPYAELHAASSFIAGLLWTSVPQLAIIYENPTPPYGGHSPLVYNWDASTQTFGVYDPNLPWPQAQPPPFQWTPSASGFQPWTTWINTHNGTVSLTFPYIFYDARGSHYDDVQLALLLARAQNRLPINSGNWWFNDLSITNPTATSPGAYPGGPSGPTYPVDKLLGTTIQFSWTCTDCDATIVSRGEWLHVYQDNVPLKVVPIIDGTASVRTNPFSGATSELIAFVSQDDTMGSGRPDDQTDISIGYAAFMRAELQPGWAYSVKWTASASGRATYVNAGGGSAVITSAQSFSGVAGFDPQLNVMSVSVEGNWVDHLSDPCDAVDAWGRCYALDQKLSEDIVDAGQLANWAWLADALQRGNDAQGPFVTNPFYLAPVAGQGCPYTPGAFPADVSWVGSTILTTPYGPVVIDQSEGSGTGYQICLDGVSQYLRPDDSTGNSFSAESTVTYGPSVPGGLPTTVDWNVHFLRAFSPSN